jgi:hypothetical protein
MSIDSPRGFSLLNFIVIVGGAVDRACKLEAMLRSLSSQRKQLRLEQSKVDNMFIKMMNDLQISLMTDEDLTVIVADTFTAPHTAQAHDVEHRDEERDQEPPSEARAEQSSNHNSFYPVKPKQEETRQDGQATPTVLTTAARGFACFANEVFDSISGTGSDETEYQQLRQRQQQQQAALAPQKHTGTVARDCGGGSVCSAPDNASTTLFPSATHPSPSAMSAGARAWRELHGKTANRGTGGVGGVDFKTGMSGHMALLSSHAHPHEYLESHRPVVTDFRKMSAHSGLTMAKPLKKTVGTLYQSMYQSLYPALNLPTLSGLSGTPERAQQTDSRSDKSDSD